MTPPCVEFPACGRPGPSRLLRRTQYRFSRLRRVHRQARARCRENQAALDDFTDRWERGEVTVRRGLSRRISAKPLRRWRRAGLPGILPGRACAGRNPDAAAFLARFPEHPVERWSVSSPSTAMLPSSRLQSWFAKRPTGDPSGGRRRDRPLSPPPRAGTGSFARVFLAEQADLENRQVVVKVSTRPTREPWLLARARHAHIVEILSHAEVDDGAFQLICMPFLGGRDALGGAGAPANDRRHRRARGGSARGPGRGGRPGVRRRQRRPVPRASSSRGLTDAQALAWITARLAEALDHAFGRDVAHGDVKPSNILLTADGNPDAPGLQPGPGLVAPRAPDRPLEDPAGPWPTWPPSGCERSPRRSARRGIRTRSSAVDGGWRCRGRLHRTPPTSIPWAWCSWRHSPGVPSSYECRPGAGPSSSSPPSTRRPPNTPRSASEGRSP